MRIFGHLDDGGTVHAIPLGQADGLQAEFLSYGGILRRLTLPARGSRRDLVLGFGDLGAYVRDTTYSGAVVGRVANRIAGAAFELDGRHHVLTANEGGNHLHGGRAGITKRRWEVLDCQVAPIPRLWLRYCSPAGEEGYPGNLSVTVELTVNADSLEVRFEAQCDAATPLSLTYHPYFNLAGDLQRPAEEQWLRIPASRYVPVADERLLPTGEIVAVENSPFDFRQLRRIGAPPLRASGQLRHAGGYDHCWVLDPEADCAAELFSPDSGIRMHVMRDRQRGVQFFGGQNLPKAHPGAGSAIALEPQDLPNAINEPRFEGTIVRPGETFRTMIGYRFNLD